MIQTISIGLHVDCPSRLFSSSWIEDRQMDPSNNLKRLDRQSALIISSLLSLIDFVQEGLENLRL